MHRWKGAGIRNQYAVVWSRKLGQWWRLQFLDEDCVTCEVIAPRESLTPEHFVSAQTCLRVA